MKVEYINPFVKAAISVVGMVLSEPPVKGELSMQPSIFTSQPVNVVFGVTGQVQGYVIFGMTLSVADRIASVMLGQPIKVFDQLAASAIAELGNMTCGNALMHLAEAGFECDISPPTIVRGQVEISTLSLPAVVIPLETGQGQLTILVGLQKKAV
jgi:chemotaxis protein CheX